MLGHVLRQGRVPGPWLSSNPGDGFVVGFRPPDECCIIVIGVSPGVLLAEAPLERLAISGRDHGTSIVHDRE